jgi:hypothetical protein
VRGEKHVIKIRMAQLNAKSMNARAPDPQLEIVLVQHEIPVPTSPAPYYSTNNDEYEMPQPYDHEAPCGIHLRTIISTDRQRIVRELLQKKEKNKGQSVARRHDEDAKKHNADMMMDDGNVKDKIFRSLKEKFGGELLAKFPYLRNEKKHSDLTLTDCETVVQCCVADLDTSYRHFANLVEDMRRFAHTNPDVDAAGLRDVTPSAPLISLSKLPVLIDKAPVAVTRLDEASSSVGGFGASSSGHGTTPTVPTSIVPTVNFIPVDLSVHAGNCAATSVLISDEDKQYQSAMESVYVPEHNTIMPVPVQALDYKALPEYNSEHELVFVPRPFIDGYHARQDVYVHTWWDCICDFCFDLFHLVISASVQRKSSVYACPIHDQRPVNLRVAPRIPSNIVVEQITRHNCINLYVLVSFLTLVVAFLNAVVFNLIVLSIRLSDCSSKEECDHYVYSIFPPVIMAIISFTTCWLHRRSPRIALRDKVRFIVPAWYDAVVVETAGMSVNESIKSIPSILRRNFVLDASDKWNTILYIDTLNELTETIGNLNLLRGAVQRPQ